MCLKNVLLTRSDGGLDEAQCIIAAGRVTLCSPLKRLQVLHVQGQDEGKVHQVELVALQSLLRLTDRLQYATAQVEPLLNLVAVHPGSSEEGK